MVVVWAHAIGIRFQLDPTFSPTGAINFNPPGHFAVLIFFILSGYVISLAHPKPLATAVAVKTYLRKRFTRIYPIYVVSLVAAIAVTGFAYSASTVVGNLLFGQTVWAPLIVENSPIWSLQYEMLFYVLFIPLSMLRVRPALVALTSTLLSFVAVYLAAKGFSGTSYSYLVGFSFWALGWALGAANTSRSVNYTLLVSALFFLLSIEYFNVFQSIYTRLALIATSTLTGAAEPENFPGAIISPMDFASLPFALFVMLQFINYKSRYFRKISSVVQLLPAPMLLYVIYNYPEMREGTSPLPALFYLISTVLFFVKSDFLNKICRVVISKVGLLGSVSYGLYVIHYPIISVFHRITIFSGNITTFIVRFILYLLLSLAAAYWLEKKFQPFVRKHTS